FLVTGLGAVGAYSVVGLLLLVCLMMLTGLSLRKLLDWLLVVIGLAGAGCRWLVSKAKKIKPAPRKKAKKRPAPRPVKEEMPEGREQVIHTEEPEPGSDIPGIQEQGPKPVVAEDFTFDLGLEQDGYAHQQSEEEKLEQEEVETGEDEVEWEGEGERISLEQGQADDERSEPAGYELPSIDLLDPPGEKKLLSREDLEQMGSALISKLADFSVKGELLNITQGPQVSTFEIRPAPGIKVGKIAALDNDLAMALAAKRIRIVAPIPGKGVVGVELPNPSPEMVRVSEIIDSAVFRDEKLVLPVGLGKGLDGRIRVADLAGMPHLLIAGTTGSGKSVCMNLLISSLLFRFTPDQVRMLMIDPKMIELTLYNDIPHLLHPVVTESKQVARIFKWATLEMENRYKLLSRNGVRNILDYNYKVDSGKPVHLLYGDPDSVPERLPYIVIMVDELSDLMCSDSRSEIENSLVRLAQMARAVGIHLIVATQRPSVDVITGLIKANFPSRMSFQVRQKIDSRTILDTNGAEQLLGNGDMLFIPAGQPDPIRIQGAYVSGEETERLVDFWREQKLAMEAAREAEEAVGEDRSPPAQGPTILEVLDRTETGDSATDDGDGEEVDGLFAEAARLVVRHDQGSTSLIQRRLKVGYARAGRIVDQLERAGILGPPDGSKAREVLVTWDELPDYGVETDV
ncbi:MAG: DNA translocase FtsK, partial [Gemmatimonadota bacterium]|nr:DNA translocase FtsK [Gemmatimonadota bacterium]